MPDFQRLPDGSLIMVGQPAPHQSRMDSFKAALRGFMDAMSPAPKQDKWWIEQPRVQAAPQPMVGPPVPAGLPTYNSGPWSEIEAKAEDRRRIVNELGDFPQRMMASPLVEGRLF